MAKVLLLDKDEANLKAMTEALGLAGTEDKDASYQSEEVHCFIMPPPLTEEEVPAGKTAGPLDHVFKALNEEPYDFVFIESVQVTGSPSKFVEDFRKRITLEANKNVQLVLLSYNEDIDYVRKMTISGLFLDYLLKPVDAPNFRQRFSLLISKDGAYTKELYSMPTLQPVNVAYNFVIEDISEFGLVLKCNRPYLPGEFVTFYSPVFKTEKQAEVIGRCFKSNKIQNSNLYKCEFVFVGAGDIIRKQVRNWMKQEYVRKKQAA